MLHKNYRMQKRLAFKTVFARGRSFASRHVVIYIFKDNPSKYGFIASKKVGNAIKRNRAKRLLREVVRLNLNDISIDCQMILIARSAINSGSYKDVEKSVLNIWKKAGILNGKNN